MQRRRFLGLASSALLLGAPGSASARARARQIGFQRWQANTDIVFDYRLLDYAGKELRLGFRLPARVVEESRRLVSAFTSEALADYVEAALRDYAARAAPDMTVHIVRGARQFEWSVEGQNQAEVSGISAALGREYNRAEAEYLRENFLVADDHRIFLDYGGIVSHYAPLLPPLAHALASATAGAGAHGRLSLALAMIQTIPYDELDGRDVESGFDFVTPPTLFDTNKGDCDSKAVALAAILRTLLEGRRQIMVLLPRHAVLGVDLPAKGGEATLRHNGRQYLLLEPAGPGPFPPGELFPDSAAAIRARRIERIAAL